MPGGIAHGTQRPPSHGNATPSHQSRPALVASAFLPVVRSSREWGFWLTMRMRYMAAFVGQFPRFKDDWGVSTRSSRLEAPFSACRRSPFPLRSERRENGRCAGGRSQEIAPCVIVLGHDAPLPNGCPSRVPPARRVGPDQSHEQGGDLQFPREKNRKTVGELGSRFRTPSRAVGRAAGLT